MENQAGLIMLMQSGTIHFIKYGLLEILEILEILAKLLSTFMPTMIFLIQLLMTINGFIGMETLGHPHQILKIYLLMQL